MDGSTAGANRSKRGPAGTALRLVGELLITAGAVMLLFVVYQLWWTNVIADQRTEQAAQRAEQLLDAPKPPEWTGGQPPTGTAFALMYIPRLRDHVWRLPVIQGVGLDQLAEGIGHYPKTAMPGQVGNFAVAGHRATHGEPFAEFDRLQDGDKVYVKTREAWYVYQLYRDKIIAPDEKWVINPQPFGAQPEPDQRLITLTTCNPRWASWQRWAYWGKLVESKKRSAGLPQGLEL
ncbi:MAG: class E sortase [Candidatus Nanopelagicales bacterium]|nr:class E sortase [Candidatus Nanopelagicales bacterium]